MKTTVEIPISPGLFRIVRILRLGRLLRFVESAKGIRQLLFTIIKSAPALSNIGTLIFLIIFIYAIMAMNMFGRLAENENINPILNFRTFGSSMCVLFRIATAAGWNNVLQAAMYEGPPKCDKTAPDVHWIKINGSSPIGPAFSNGVVEGSCGNKYVAIIFFVSYILLIVLIIINTYIAVILENFNDAQSQEDVGITEGDIEEYYETWQLYDPQATQFIKYQDLSQFLDELQQPFRVEKPNYWFIEEMDMPVKDCNRVHCLDILQTLIRHILGEEKCAENEHTSAIMKRVNLKYKQIFPQRFKKTTLTTTTEFLKQEQKAASKVQRAFRWYLLHAEIDSFLRGDKKHFEKVHNISVYRKCQKIEKLILAIVASDKRRKEIERKEEELRRQQEEYVYIDSDDNDYNNDDVPLSIKEQVQKPLLSL